MIPKPLKSFISRLRESTDDGDIKWTGGATDSYYCNHNSHELHISYSFDPDSGESSFHFLIKSKGKEAFFSVISDENDYSIMKGLYESVGVQASGFDDIEDQFFG